MSRSRLVPLFFAMLLVVASGTFAQEKKEPPKDEKKEKEPTGKLKGFLPQNWGKIGLTDQQKQDVYKVQNKYRDEIDRLTAKIDELKKQQKIDMEKVLTDEQKKRLREILIGEEKK
jgi:Spy/CpxP family protein refolding chaperone